MKLKLEVGRPLDGSFHYHCDHGTWLWQKVGDELEVPDDVASALLALHGRHFKKEIPAQKNKAFTKAPEVKDAASA